MVMVVKAFKEPLRRTRPFTMKSSLPPQSFEAGRKAWRNEIPRPRKSQLNTRP
ncbi:hypothetical protein OIU77_006021 [Salix suchowensis]|uniref:Uncharacterized protein n=2 Tax=Salix TaxID=40685 RepID=A0A9Q0W2I5_9ROSI|nr:hypothetical protein OIU78_023832 [Salix suchowensis]KAJ6355546.1 hypothetical protein OIU77_006021 [Salix suchowensis]KAJ6759451.1 hypothetical protein OIU74_026017 [Salix koriyanagi]